MKPRYPLLIVLMVVIALSMAGTASALAPTSVGGDPIWCPVGVVFPVSGTGGCSPSFTTLSGLLAWLRTNDPNQAGVIWLERTYNSASEGVTGFTFDGTSFARFDNNPLIIQGGWDGPGTNTINHSSPSVFSGNFLHFDRWGADVTINDILVDRPAATGISISNTGNITFSNVVTQNSVGSLGNMDGATLINYMGTGNVTVRGSGFYGNHGSGLSVFSSGAITLQNVTANNNGNSYDGAMLDNRTSTTAQPVTINGSNTFNGNGSGLDVFSHGPIVVYGITSTGNTLTGGVYLDNTSAITPQPVNLIGSSHYFGNNAHGGLVINSHGPITAEYISSSYNGYWGTVLNNGGVGAVGDLTLNLQNAFLNNGWSGLNAFSNGVITISGITADHNGGDGLMLGGPDNVGLYCANKVYSNGGYGVNAGAVSGPLILNDVTFDGLNVSGDYSYPGTATIGSGCAPSGFRRLRVTNLLNDSLLTLDCAKFSGSEMVLPDGRRVVFYCPTLGDVTLRFEKIGPLPGPLPDKTTFVSAMDLSLKADGGDQIITPGPTTVTFAPTETKGVDYTILYWDGKQWVDLNQASFNDGRKVIKGGSFTYDGYFEATTNFTGLFVLVKR